MQPNFWQPSSLPSERSGRMGTVLPEGMTTVAGYRATYDESLTSPESFWGEQAGLVDWFVKPSVVLDRSRPPFYRWFTGGVLNTCYNALDRHVIHGRADQPALIYDSPVTGASQTYSYSTLLEKVAAFAAVLRDCGVGVGDRVVIYLPMIPEAVIAMLATARLGAVHSVVFGGFAAAELAVRIDDALAYGCCHGLVRDRAEPSRSVQTTPRQGTRPGRARRVRRRRQTA